VVAAILCGGCGSSTHKHAQATKPLAAAIYARCGTGAFAPPAATPTSKKTPPSGWQVVYTYPPLAPRRPLPGQTTIVTLVERAPAGPSPKLTGGREVMVAGRRVSLRNRTNRTMYVALWKTGKAHYLALADGATPATLERIIGCLP
jgi:hypothetical protein